MKTMKRVAVFYHSETPQPGFQAIDVGEGYTAYVRGELAPESSDALSYGLKKHTKGENFMNSHTVTK
jgi:hypothetical protein